jgi:hypothetical protein
MVHVLVMVLRRHTLDADARCFDLVFVRAGV